MNNLEVKEITLLSTSLRQNTPCDHIYLISAIFTSVLYVLLFHYLCNKKVCNYTVTPASRNQNWAGLQGIIFCCFLKTHTILPKKLSKCVAAQPFL